MIEVWFNERGYYAQGSKGESRFIYDLPIETTKNAAMLYTMRWMVLNHLLDVVSELGDKTRKEDLVLYTDSRLIEELQGELTPDNTFAKDSHKFFVENDYQKFRRVTFQKCAPTTINGKLGEPINTT